MISHETNSRDSITNSSSFRSVPDWDQPFTDQELEAIDAIEASFRSQSTSLTTPSPSVFKKRLSRSQDNGQQDRPKNRRRLPSSVLGPSKPFSLFPCRDHQRMRYPAMKFGGRICYSRTEMEVEKAARELLQSIDARKGEMGQVSVGFDIEWKPTFRKGVLPGKAAVMQICGDSNLCHVMHIIHSGITQSLRLLLEDHTLLKIGVGIGNDCVKVFKDYNISVKPVEDLSCLANRKLGGEPKVWGLQSLTELLVCKELLKPNKIRLGNWEVDVLSKEQLQYAATDAFASWHLYQVLRSLPDTKESNDIGSTESNVVLQ